MNFSKNGFQVDIKELQEPSSPLLFFNEVKGEIGSIKTTGSNNSNNVNERWKNSERDGSRLKSINAQNNNLRDYQTKNKGKKRTFERFNTSNNNKKRKITEQCKWNCTQCTFWNDFERRKCEIYGLQMNCRGTVCLLREIDGTSIMSQRQKLQSSGQC